MTLGPLVVVLVAWGLLALVMLALWQVQSVRGDAGIVNVAWAGGLGVLQLVYAGVLLHWWCYVLLAVGTGGPL